MPALRERLADIPELMRFCLLEALRSPGLQPLVRQYLARFPTPLAFREEQNAVVFGRPSLREARRDAITVFLSRTALGQLGEHDWPGNVRELKLFATNALVHALSGHLDAAAPEQPESVEARAPAILALPDALVDRLLSVDPPGRRALRPARPPQAGDRGRRMEIEVPRGTSFSRISAEVERQYLRAMFVAASGDLEKMAAELFGPRGTGRQVHLRLNQLGLKLRELRARASRPGGAEAAASGSG